MYCRTFFPRSRILNNCLGNKICHGSIPVPQKHLAVASGPMLTIPNALCYTLLCANKEELKTTRNESSKYTLPKSALFTKISKHCFLTGLSQL